MGEPGTASRWQADLQTSMGPRSGGVVQPGDAGSKLDAHELVASASPHHGAGDVNLGAPPNKEQVNDCV